MYSLMTLVNTVLNTGNFLRFQVLWSCIQKNGDREDDTLISLTISNQGLAAVRVQEGEKEQLHIQGQEGQPWGDTPHPRYGAAAALCWSSHEEISHVQHKRNPSKTVRVARGIRGQPHWNHTHRKLVNLITWTTALSNSMKLSHAMWGHPRRAGHGGEVWQNVVHWRREWQTTSVFLPWEPHAQYEKAKW